MAVEYEWNVPITDTTGATCSVVILEVVIVNREVQLYSESYIRQNCVTHFYDYPISKYPAINLNDNLISNYLYIPVPASNSLIKTSRGDLLVYLGSATCNQAISARAQRQEGVTHRDHPTVHHGNP